MERPLHSIDTKALLDAVYSTKRLSSRADSRYYLDTEFSLAEQSYHSKVAEWSLLGGFFAEE